MLIVSMYHLLLSFEIPKKIMFLNINMSDFKKNAFSILTDLRL